MTRLLRRIDWTALGASVGSTILLALLASMPLLLGIHYGYWLIVMAIGAVLGVYLYIQRKHDGEPGPDADETRFPR